MTKLKNVIQMLPGGPVNGGKYKWFYIYLWLYLMFALFMYAFISLFFNFLQVFAASLTTSECLSLVAMKISFPRLLLKINHGLHFLRFLDRKLQVLTLSWCHRSQDTSFYRFSATLVLRLPSVSPIFWMWRTPVTSLEC